MVPRARPAENLQHAVGGEVRHRSLDRGHAGDDHDDVVETLPAAEVAHRGLVPSGGSCTRV